MNRHVDLNNFRYGLQNGLLVFIDDVPNGLGCGCICPSCLEPLVAYNNPNNSKATHFQHHNLSDCEGYYETLLHYFAKTIIEERKYLVVPDVHFHLSNRAEEFRSAYSQFSSRSESPIRINFDSVELERSEGSFRPDIKASANGKIIYIEIAVTHFIDSEKLSKMPYDSAILEIDLSKQERICSKDQLEKVLTDIGLMKWHHNPKIGMRFNLSELRGKTISNFVEANLISYKEYGRDRKLFNCPLHKGSINAKDHCSKCKFKAGELVSIPPPWAGYPEYTIECIGHVAKEFHQLLQKNAAVEKRENLTAKTVSMKMLNEATIKIKQND